MNWKQTSGCISILSIFTTIIIWNYEERITIQKDKYEQEILSIKSIFADNKQVLLLKDIIADGSNYSPTKGKYFPKSNIYALEEINGFTYTESTTDNLYALFNRCNQKTFWNKIFDKKKFNTKSKTLTDEQEKFNNKWGQYLKKKILSNIKPTINYWIQNNSDIEVKSCIIEFKVNNQTLKKAMQNTLDFLANPLFVNADTEKVLTNLKEELDKNNSQKIFQEFITLFSNLISGFSKEQRIILTKKNIFFMGFSLPNNHITLLGVLNNKYINFVILSNYHNEPFLNQTTENKMNHWLSQYRIILNKNN